MACATGWQGPEPHSSPNAPEPRFHWQLAGLRTASVGAAAARLVHADAGEATLLGRGFPAPRASPPGPPRSKRVTSHPEESDDDT